MESKILNQEIEKHTKGNPIEPLSSRYQSRHGRDPVIQTEARLVRGRARHVTVLRGVAVFSCL